MKASTGEFAKLMQAELSLSRKTGENKNNCQVI